MNSPLQKVQAQCLLYKYPIHAHLLAQNPLHNTYSPPPPPPPPTNNNSKKERPQKHEPTYPFLMHQLSHHTFLRTTNHRLHFHALDTIA